MVAKVLALALLIVAVQGQNAKCGADDNNGFEMTECGDKVKICCHPTRQVCLTGTPKGKDAQYECSANRALYGMKLVTVFIIPICSEIFLLGVFVIMLMQLKKMAPKPMLAKLCLMQTILAMLLVFSPYWKFAIYSAFVAVTVFFMGQLSNNKWIVIFIIGLQLFNLIATIGAYGTSGIFVPLGLLSSDNVKSWEAGVIDFVIPGARCSGYYGNYFNVESVELNAEGADPQVKFHGFCGEDWMATVGTVVISKTVIQLFMLVLSLQLLVSVYGAEQQLKDGV